jgi:hypothetical protein
MYVHWCIGHSDVLISPSLATVAWVSTVPGSTDVPLPKIQELSDLIFLAALLQSKFFDCLSEHPSLFSFLPPTFFLLG